MMRAERNIVIWVFVLFSCEPLMGQTQNQREIDSLNTILRSAKEDTAKVNTLNRLTWVHYNVGEFAKAKETAALSLQLAEKLEYKKGKAEVLNNLGTIYWGTGNLDKALEYVQASSTINREIGNKLGLGNNLNNIANNYYVRGDYPDAIRNYKLALKEYEAVGHTPGIVRVNNNMGSTYNMQGNTTLALTHYFTVLKLSQEKGERTILALCYRNIGEIYQGLSNYDESLNYYRKALAIYQKVGSKVSIANTYRIIGGYYTKLGRYEEALQNLHLALELFTAITDAGFIVQTNNDIGKVLLAQGKYTAALEKFRSSSAAWEKGPTKQFLAGSYVNIGDALSKLAEGDTDPGEKRKKIEEAIQFLGKGLSLAKTIGIKEVAIEAHRILAEIYRSMKDHDSAWEHNRLYTVLKDSLQGTESTRRMDQQRIKFEVDKAVTEERLNKEKAVAIEKLRFELALAEENAEQEKLLLAQQYESAKKLSATDAIHQQELAQEKSRQELKEAETNAQQEKEKAAIKRRNELLLMGGVLLLFALVFVFLNQRQRTQKQRAIERADAIHRMTELELQSLRAQLNPHFMFNSLNAIQELILMEDNERSHVYLSRFSKLIRILLDNANQPFVPLKKELDFLELYLSLEKLRIPDLEYKIEKEPGIDANNTAVPNMMLQPYIENAIWHGLSPKQGDKKLLLRIHGSNGSIQYDIEDNGIGRQKAAEMKSLYRKEHKSKGMELLTKRFKLLNEEFGSEIKTDITDITKNGHVGGTRVTIYVPRVLSGSVKEAV